MPTEIERKFLVAGEIPGGDDSHIVQAYLSLDLNRIVRVRIEDDFATLTIKGKAAGISRPEFEYSIPQPDAVELLKLAVGQAIEKTRRRIKIGESTWEVDSFAGANQGLIVAEIELPTESAEFEKPSWLGEEVTDDPRYTNSSLVNLPFGDWGSANQDE